MEPPGGHAVLGEVVSVGEVDAVLPEQVTALLLVIYRGAGLSGFFFSAS
jgi:hypothetical protein